MGVRPLIKVDREDSGVYICSLGEKIENLEKTIKSVIEAEEMVSMNNYDKINY